MKFNVYKIKNPENENQANWLLAFSDEENVSDLYELIQESEYTYKHRLAIEFQELKSKYFKLSNYIISNPDKYFGTYTTLHVQESIMKSYLEILKLRMREEGMI